MKLGDGVEAALHCTALLAGLPDDKAMSAAALADFHGISTSYLLKHLKSLVKSGILKSYPGPTGGYRLAKQPIDITLLDVVLAVEGPEPAFRCREIRMKGSCQVDKSAYPAPCGFNRAMLRAEAAYRAALSETTMQDILLDFVDTSDPRSVQRGQSYVTEHQRHISK
ncbi:MAG: Rrf2 family transcriptional regulator [Thalassovita sp.]